MGVVRGSGVRRGGERVPSARVENTEERKFRGVI